MSVLIMENEMNWKMLALILLAAKFHLRQISLRLRNGFDVDALDVKKKN